MMIQNVKSVQVFWDAVISYKLAKLWQKALHLIRATLISFTRISWAFEILTRVEESNRIAQLSSQEALFEDTYIAKKPAFLVSESHLSTVSETTCYMESFPVLAESDRLEHIRVSEISHMILKSNCMDYEAQYRSQSGRKRSISLLLSSWDTIESTSVLGKL